MYRNRLMIISLLILFLVPTLIIALIPKPNYEAFKIDTYYLDTKQQVQDQLNSYWIYHNGWSNKLKNNTVDLADIMVTTREREDIPEKFNKSNVISLGYSPVVMAISMPALEKVEVYEGAYKKDMKNILLKFSENSSVTASDIDVGGDKLYKLLIPDIESPHRRVVIDTIIMELLDGKEPTEENIESIKPILNKVLTNSYIIPDIGEVLNDLWTTNYIVLFPEHLLAGRKIPIQVIYSDNIVCEQLYMYYNKEIEEMIEGYADKLKEQQFLVPDFLSPDFLLPDFREVTGYRVLGYKTVGFKRKKPTNYKYTADTINNTVVPDSLISLMGDNYWRMVP